MERMKRAVCLLLCLVMVVGILPMTAFAAGGVSDTDTGSIAGGYVYTLDTDGYETGSNNKYLFVASDAAYAMDEDATGVVPVTFNGDETEATVDSRDYEWYITTVTTGN